MESRSTSTVYRDNSTVQEWKWNCLCVISVCSVPSYCELYMKERQRYMPTFVLTIIIAK